MGDRDTSFDPLTQALIEIDAGIRPEVAAELVTASLLRYLEDKDLLKVGTIVRLYQGDLDEDVLIFV